MFVIDLRAYISECSKDFDAVECNCFTAVLAAFPKSDRVAALALWWHALSDNARYRAATSRLVPQVRRKFAELSFPPAPLAATGREIGIAYRKGILRPTFCVGAPGAWFARGDKAAQRLRGDLVTMAWFA